MLRSPEEARAAGDLTWFAPGLERLGANGAADGFIGTGAPVMIARAPGRLDVMGGISDYSGGLVLEMPLDRSTYAVLQPQPERRLEVLSLRGDAPSRFSIDLDALQRATPAELAARFAHDPERRWGAYVAGVAHACLARTQYGDRVMGARLLIVSDVPEGKGVASSAALEVACMLVFAAHCGLELSPMVTATLCQWAENHVAASPCGIMDQVTSACGEAGRLLRLRCQPAEIEGHIAVPAGFRFYGIDSGIRHEVSGADYHTVRTAAFMGYRLIADHAGLPVRAGNGNVSVEDARWRGYLANLTPDEFAAVEASVPDQMVGEAFLARYNGITDTVTAVRPHRTYSVRRAAAHPVHERARVERFLDLLAGLDGNHGNAVEMGELMYGSHAAYSACGLGSSGTDRLVEMVRDVGPRVGLFGAKITGGGSGGTVAVLGTEEARVHVERIAARYRAESGRGGEVFAGSAPGAIHTGVLALAEGWPSLRPGDP